MSVEQETKSAITTVETLNDFKSLLKELKNSFHSYDTIKDEVSKLKSGEQYQFHGMTIDKVALRQMKTDIGNRISDLYRYFGKGGKAKKVKSTDEKDAKPRKNGFDNPVYVSKFIVDFYTKNPSILGNDASGRPIAPQLASLVSGGLTTSTILTNLWSIILHTQKTKIISTVQELDTKTGKTKDVTFYHADDNMKNHFGSAGSNTFTFLSSKPGKIGKDKKALPSFNPDRFAYTGWQSIFAHNKLATDKAGAFNLSKDHENMLTVLKEYRNLTTRNTPLTPDESIIVQSVEKGAPPAGATQEQLAKVRNYMVAKQHLDRLAQEKAIVTAALSNLKSLNPPAPKKSKTKAKVDVNGSVPSAITSMSNGLTMPSFNASMSVPKL